MTGETAPAFSEGRSARTTPLRDLGLRIEGTALAPLVDEVLAEWRAAGLSRVTPRFYLSTEWGVCEGSVAVAIPFYLASDELTALHADRVGHVEGTDREDLLRYLRHELGHACNYAWRLHDEPDWHAAFGDFRAPYHESYRPHPFSHRHVRHLPGWYAQKHPDEDWSETFAVWMTPGRDWRTDYAAWPVALSKLEACDALVRAAREREPAVASWDDGDLDDDVGALTVSLDDYYALASPPLDLPVGMDSALRALFDDLRSVPTGSLLPASSLMRRLERDLMAATWRWTGHFPELTRELVRHLAERAEALGLAYPAARETEAAVAVTALVTSLAMTHVHGGSYGE